MTTDYRLRTPADRLSLVVASWRWLVPASTVLTLNILGGAPIILPWPALPALGLLGVFVWVTFQPGLMPPWLAFLLGLTADLLSGLPLGVEGVLFAATALFVRLFERRFGHHRFGFDWLVMVGLATLHAVLGHALLGIAGVTGPLLPLFIQAATTVAAYPLVVLLCARIQRRLLIS